MSIDYTEYTDSDLLYSLYHNGLSQKEYADRVSAILLEIEGRTIVGQIKNNNKPESV